MWRARLRARWDVDMQRYRLYGRKNSGSFAVQVALEQIGAPYDVAWISNEATDVAAYRKLNPTGRVPALELPDGTVMFESAAILIHLALVHPDSGLAPQPGSGRHGLFLQWMVFLSANVYEAVLRVYYSDRYSAAGQMDAAAVREQGVADFVQHLELIGQQLAPFVLGGEYSIADVYLYMLASWFPDGKEALFARLPALRRHAELLATRLALSTVEAAHAD
jgi:GST-like protein